MNWDQLTGEWKQLRGKVREALAKLTDDQIDEVRARKDIVVGKAQAQYGATKEKAARKMDEYLAKQ